MAAQSGKDMLLKLDQTGSGSFVTVAGLRTRSLAFNAAAIDVTDAESAGRWRELLAGGGIKRAAVDAGKALKLSRDELTKLGGWSDPQMADRVYADVDALAAATGAARARLAIRGEPTGEGDNAEA